MRRRRMRNRCVTNRLWLGGWSWRSFRSLGLVLFDLTDELVGFFLCHLTAANHELHEIASAFHDKATESGCGVDDILHGSGHFAARLQADLMCFCRHLGDSVLDV